MEKHIEEFILQADSKALATHGTKGINVIPVSSLKIIDGDIWLINYFMDKTLENILENKEVSLVCWSKMFKKARLVLMPLFLTPRELYSLDKKLLCYRLVWVSSTIISPCPECLRPVTSGNRCPNTKHMEFKSLFNEEIDCLRKIAILPRFAEELNK